VESYWTNDERQHGNDHRFERDHGKIVTRLLEDNWIAEHRPPTVIVPPPVHHSPPPGVVPEPAGWVLLGLGMVGAFFLGRYRR
jgi:hypothetical protein